MISKDFIPAEPLKDYVSQYRLRHFIFENGRTPSHKPFPPRPEQSIAFYIRGSETAHYIHSGKTFTKPRSVVSGQFTTRVNRFVSIPEILMIIVDLKPGALFRLTGIPSAELTNLDVDAEAIFSSGIRNLNDQLNSIADYSLMIKMIETFFIRLIQSSNKSMSSVDHVLSSGLLMPDCTVDYLKNHSFLSTRQLERKFYERAGVGPKAFLRINQFNQSYWMKLKNANLSWLDIALNCGYTDYQHLAKAYKEFTLTTPNLFFQEEEKAPGRVLFPVNT